MECGNLTADIIAANCAKLGVAGTTGMAYIMRYKDIDKSLSTVTGNVISAITMKDDTRAYEFTTIDNSPLGETTANVGTYLTQFQHDLTLRIFTKTEANKDFVNQSANESFVIILANKELGTANDAGTTTGNTKYEVYGWDSGLKLSELTATTDMTDGVVYGVKYGSTDRAREKTLPKSFFATSLATTEAAIEALITPAA